MATEIIIETDGGTVVVPHDSTSVRAARNVIVSPAVLGTQDVQAALEALAEGGSGPGGNGSGAPVGAQYVVMQASPTLTNERVLTAGSGVTITDAATDGGPVTIAASVTKADVGLGNVDNTSDLDKPVSTATQTALDGKANATHTHVAADVTDFAAEAAAAAPVSTVAGRTGAVVIAAGDIASGTFDAARIPSLDASKIETGTLDIARIPTGTGGTQVALGDHTHAIGDTTGLQGALDGKASATHTHGAITNDGKVGSDAGRVLVTGSGGDVEAFGAGTSGQVLTQGAAGLEWAAVSGTGTVTSVTAGTGLTGGEITSSGTIAADIGTGAGQVAAGNHTHDAAAITSGTLNADRIPTLAQSKITNLETDLSARVPTSRTITTGDGLTGGGNLTADRTLAVELAPISFLKFDGSGRLQADVGAGATQVASGSHGHDASAIATGTLGFNLLPTGTGSTQVAVGNHGHGAITTDGKIGSTSGLPVVTTTGGDLTTLPLGTANQVLRVNSNATAVEFGTVSGGTGDVATDAIWTTKGEIAVATGSAAAVAVGVGSNGQVLTADSNETSGVKWSTVTGTGTVTSVAAGDGLTGGTITTTGTLAVDLAASGGLVFDANKKITADFGTTSGKVAEGDHTHTAADITDFATAVETELLANLPTDNGELDIAQESTLQAALLQKYGPGQVTGTLPIIVTESESDGVEQITISLDTGADSSGKVPQFEDFDQLAFSGKIGSDANKPIITTTGGELIAGAFGSGANEFAEGNHGHSDATDSVAGFMSSADKAKLDGVAANATANAGTVTSVGTGDGLSGGAITDSGTIAIDLATDPGLEFADGKLRAKVDGVIERSNDGLRLKVAQVNPGLSVSQNGLAVSFGASAGTAAQGNDSRFSKALDDLTDVDLTSSPSDGDLLVYDGTAGKWDLASEANPTAHTHGIIDSYVGEIEAAANRTYTIDRFVATTRTITEVRIQSTGGTCTAKVFNGANEVVEVEVDNSTSGGSTPTLSDATVSAGGAITLVVSANDDAVNVSFAIVYTTVTGAIT